MKLTERNFGLPIFALIIGAFLFVGSQRLGAVPLPDSGDESMILQVPYEILNRGLFAWPMYRYLGGNIENTWHSFRPVYYLSMTGFFKVFGWGLLQGRAFNLMAAALVLGVVFLIGRRLFDWRVGLVAVVMLISDNTFVERSRMVRNEYLGAMFALLAFYLFEAAEQRKRGWLYAASGLAAGAGVMTHANTLYILGAIVLLMLLRHGWRALASRSTYLFAGSALVVMAYEIVYDVVDYANVRLQYHGDRAHFGRVSSSGLWQNVLDEPARYKDWVAGSLLFSDVPRTLQHVFQVLTVVALVFVIATCVRQFRRAKAVDDPRARVLVVTLIAMLFLAIATGRRRKYAIYMAYLTPWFALCVGILLRDGVERMGRLRSKPWRFAELSRKAALIAVALAGVAYGALLVRQNVRFIREVTNPHVASFEEFARVLRSIVPESVCPASIERPVMWLAFPEFDRCYASIERRMADNVDIDGKDYALILSTRKNPVYIKDPDENYTLLGKMENTPYGDMRVYYTGTDPRYRSLAPVSYQFFERWRGHLRDDQIAAARPVWSANAKELSAGARSADAVLKPDGLDMESRGSVWLQHSVDLCSVELKPNTAYEVIVDGASSGAGWHLVIVDAATDQLAKQIVIAERQGSQRIEGLFRTFDTSRVRIAARAGTERPGAPLCITRVTINEVGELTL